MHRNLVRGRALLILSLLSLYVTACVTDGILNLSKEEKHPYDICTSGIEAFYLSDVEADTLLRSNLENMTLINCTLYEECGFAIPNDDPTICETTSQ